MPICTLYPIRSRFWVVIKLTLFLWSSRASSGYLTRYFLICKLMNAYPWLGLEFHKFPTGRKPFLRPFCETTHAIHITVYAGWELLDGSVICIHELHIWEIKAFIYFFIHISSGRLSLMHRHYTLSRPSRPNLYLILSFFYVCHGFICF